MGNVLLVGVGGFIGSVLRYILSGLAQEWTKRDDFPVGTLAVNVIGSLLIFFSRASRKLARFR